MTVNGHREFPTVGILYCGDLGSALTRLLRRTGLRVVTTCEDRSLQTRERAGSSGVEVLSTLDDVVRESDLVFSLVLPVAAKEVARQYAARESLRPEGSLFVDANSIGMETFSDIQTILLRREIPFVDATIQGGARHLAEIGVMYVSGPQADRVETVCRDILHVVPLGDQVGMATQMKLLMAAIAKSLGVLFLEAGVLADRAKMLPQFLEGCRGFYPGVMTAVERMLPTYPRHARRRVGELQSVERLARSHNAPCEMIHAAGELMQVVADMDWSVHTSGAVADTVPEVIRSVSQAYQSETQLCLSMKSEVLR